MEEQNTIVLVNPPFEDIAYPPPPLGLGYIAAFLRNAGFDCEILDLQAEDCSLDNFGLITTLQKKKPEIVGITCCNKSFKQACYLVKKIRHHFPDLTIGMGGPFATFSDEYVIEYLKDLNFVARGEGEQTMLEICEASQKENKDFQAVKGVTYRNRNGSIHRNPLRELTREQSLGRLAELDFFPSPYLSNTFDLNLYKRASISTSRGCPYHCAFCCCGPFFGHSIRFHSIERILQEIRYIAQHNIKRIFFVDDVFTINKERIQNLCEKIMGEKLDVELEITTRADCLSPKLLESLKKAGVINIHIGLESAKKDTLEILKKNLDPSQVKKAASLIKKHGINLSVSLIIGLPFEDKKDVLESLAFASELDADNYGIYVLEPIPGSELFKKHRDFGLTLKRTDHLFSLSSTSFLSKEDLDWLTTYAQSIFPTEILFDCQKEQYLFSDAIANLTTGFSLKQLDNISQRHLTEWLSA